MHLDVVDLRAFYYRTKLGRAVQRDLQETIAKRWPDSRQMQVVGFGFAAPLLRPHLGTARRVLSLMPAAQGVMRWPPGDANLSTLVEETQWPLPGGSVDRIIVAHGLETCEAPEALLDEIWRVLAPGGKVMFIVPNRAGFWARRDTTPFGYGRPYSMGQLEALLRARRFQPGWHAKALYMWPSHRAFWLRTARLFGRIGRRLGLRIMAGALVVEATKQVYAPPSGLRDAVRAPLDVLQGLARPRPATNRAPNRTRGASTQEQRFGNSTPKGEDIPPA
ncbi:class I SAM-dependent methyltransferase [Abyssibius alkaniclasticus]|uniref:class I SAM-dependent methyltransferase n=1 Tax=Abyssibius alkaniclasticus TaxID=2881234 RepID=UPI0023644E36|nr:methyltransferase domain-containing protein [Abyssibius alkaniclasticus]UPH71551.1 class I SAM-dependent methyltransferase [Abyssibius alkaniclasticus]